MTRATLLISCICGVFTVPLAQAFSLAQPTGPANAPELTISARWDDGAIAVELVMRNTSGQPLRVSFVDREPPFELSIWDEAGNDRYQCTYKNRVKDGKSVQKRQPSALKQVELAANASSRFAVKVAHMCDASSQRTGLQPGTYRVEARLAVAAETGTRSTILTSNTVAVRIP